MYFTMRCSSEGLSGTASRLGHRSRVDSPSPAHPHFTLAGGMSSRPAPDGRGTARQSPDKHGSAYVARASRRREGLRLRPHRRSAEIDVFGMGLDSALFDGASGDLLTWDRAARDRSSPGCERIQPFRDRRGSPVRRFRRGGTAPRGGRSCAGFARTPP